MSNEPLVALIEALGSEKVTKVGLEKSLPPGLSRKTKDFIQRYVNIVDEREIKELYLTLAAIINAVAIDVALNVQFTERTQPQQGRKEILTGTKQTALLDAFIWVLVEMQEEGHTPKKEDLILARECAELVALQRSTLRRLNQLSKEVEESIEKESQL